MRYERDAPPRSVVRLSDIRRIALAKLCAPTGLRSSLGMFLSRYSSHGRMAGVQEPPFPSKEAKFLGFTLGSASSLYLKNFD